MVKGEQQRQSDKQKTGSYKLQRRWSGQRVVSPGVKSVGIIKGQGRLPDRTLKYRHEMKYVVSQAKAYAIARFIEPYLKLDRYCTLQPSGMYPIVSLYLDSDNLRLCRESLEGHKNRFKLRIRSYTDEPEYPLFFEIKRRANTIIIKTRARVMRSDVATLLSGLHLPPQSYKTDEETLKQFQLYMNSIGARAMIRVRYIRQAYEGDSENRVRVTFDRELAYNVGNSPEVSFDSGNWQRHPVNGVILEIKFTGRYPAWLSRMVECFDLRARSMSKYATSVKKACSMRFCAPKILM